MLQTRYVKSLGLSVSLNYGKGFQINFLIVEATIISIN